MTRGGVWRDASLAAFDQVMGPDHQGLGLRPRVGPGLHPDLRSHFLGFTQSCVVRGLRARVVDSALTLLVPRILANHHHATVPANHLALVADLLDARLDLHASNVSDRVGGFMWDWLTCAGRRCARG